MNDKYKIYLVAFLAGFISLELEILGTRLISPIFGSTIYVWTSLIGITLAFLALGYWYGGKLADKGKLTINKLGIIIFFLGIYIALLPFISRVAIYLTNDLGILFGPLITAFLILAIPVFFLGFIVPTSIKLATSSLEEIGTTSGKIYSLATIGSIVGVFATGFFFIFYFGVIKTALITGIMLIIISLFFVLPRIKILSIFAILLLLLLPHNLPAEVKENFDSPYGQVRIMEHGENLRLFINTIPQTSINTKTLENGNSNWKYYELPFLYNEGKKALMIGFAGGYTIKELIEKHNLEMDVAEIEPKMLDLAREYFYWQDEADFYVDDGRHFVTSSDQKYDVIIIDIGNVLSASHLYTLEAFQEYEKHLSTDGILIINIFSAVYGEKSKVLHSLYKTLEEIFPDVLILRSIYSDDFNEGSITLLASKKEINKEQFLAVKTGLPIKEMLENNELFTLNKQAKITTDDFPAAEFYDYANWNSYSRVGKKSLKYFLP